MQAAAPPRVLLVEDDVMTGLALADMLEAADFAVDGPHRTVADAMAALAQEFPDYALLDLRLGRQDSLLVAEDLERYGIGFAFYSGADRQGAVPRHFDHSLFFRKPLDPAGVIEAVRSATRH